jgi:hypothetical protein
MTTPGPLMLCRNCGAVLPPGGRRATCSASCARACRRRLTSGARHARRARLLLAAALAGRDDLARAAREALMELKAADARFHRAGLRPFHRRITPTKTNDDV